MHVARMEAKRDEMHEKNTWRKGTGWLKPWRKWEDNIRIELKKKWVNVNLIRLVHKYHWWALGKPVMNPAVIKNMGNFMSRYETFSFSMVLSMTLVTGRNEELNARWSKRKVAGHEGTWRSGGKSPFIPNLGTKWSWVVTFTPQLLYSRRRAPNKHSIGVLEGPRTGRDGLENRKIPARFVTLCNADRANPAPTRYPIQMYWLKWYISSLELSVSWNGYFPQSYLFSSMTAWQLQLAPVLHVEFTWRGLHMKDRPYSSADCTTTPHKKDSPSLVQILSQMNPTYKLVTCISNNHLHFTLLSTSRSSKWSFPFGISD